MGILLAFLGGEIITGFIFLGLLFAAGDFIWSAIGTIITWIFYIIFGCTALFGLYTIKEHTDGKEIAVGIFVFLFGAAGIFLIADAEGINDYIKQRQAKQQTAILDNAKTFLSVENLCDSENIESVEILFTPKLADGSPAQNVNSQRIQNANWEQAWPSKSSMVPFEITGIPVSKNDTNFAIRLTTKDKKSINNIYFVYHKVYIEPKDINPNGAALIEFAYNGTKLIIKNGDIIKNDEPFFSENTIVFMEHDAMYIDINDNFIYLPSIKWDMHKYSNCRKDYLDSYYNHLDTSGIPLNITMKYLEPGAEFTVSYTDFSTTPVGRIEQKYTAGEKNLISVGKNSVSVSCKPCFTKFDYTKAFFN